MLRFAFPLYSPLSPVVSRFFPTPVRFCKRARSSLLDSQSFIWIKGDAIDDVDRYHVRRDKDIFLDAIASDSRDREINLSARWESAVAPLSVSHEISSFTGGLEP